MIFKSVERATNNVIPANAGTQEFFHENGGSIPENKNNPLTSKIL
jgi:hypothetical protein